MKLKFCDELRVLLAEKKVKKIDLARSLGVSRQTVHNWTAGRTVPPVVAPLTQGDILAAVSADDGLTQS